MNNITNFLFCGFRKIYRLSAGYDSRVLRKIVYYPEVNDREVLADIANRAAWYFPSSRLSDPEVVIPVQDNLLGVNICNLNPPKAQERYLDNDEAIKLVAGKELRLSQADAIMLWDSKCLYLPKVLAQLQKVFVVDPLFYSYTESESHRQVFYRTLSHSKRTEMRSLSISNYEALMRKVGHREKAFVFGTGPSISKAAEFDFSQGFNVICNSIVKNRPLLSHIGPHLLVFGDPVFHLSPCKYSAEFRRFMLETVRAFDCFVMLPEYNVPLYLAYFPELERRIIGMPDDKGAFNFPTPQNFRVRNAGSVMTLFMLPVASSVANEIYVIGADGRQRGETYFWKHSQSTQFGDLMETALATHPSFFRDRKYDEYYEAHCKTMEELICYGESLGKKYFSLTDSAVPALAKRHAPQERK